MKTKKQCKEKNKTKYFSKIESVKSAMYYGRKSMVGNIMKKWLFETEVEKRRRDDLE